MTLEQYILNINSAYKRGIVLDGIPNFNLEELKNSIVADVTANKSGMTGEASSLSLEIVRQITDKFGLSFVPENEIGNLCFANNNEELRDVFVQNFSAIDILDYLYAVLHASKCRKENNDSLETIPYPTSLSGFRTLIVLGRQLRQIHYQKRIVSLTETHRLMNEIDKIEIE